MFTGIIETLGTVQAVLHSGSNRTFWIQSPLSTELKVDQSISHNGVCLTVEEIKGDQHRVTAIEETLKKSNLGDWNTGDTVNLERCMIMNGRLDGHIVQGHVDTIATCIERKELEGSWEFRIQFPRAFAPLIIEKGSVSLNGISLTAFDVQEDSFKVAIIPYTFTHTNMQDLHVNDNVNIEFDMIGKYVTRLMHFHPADSLGSAPNAAQANPGSTTSSAQAAGSEQAPNSTPAPGSESAAQAPGSTQVPGSAQAPAPSDAQAASGSATAQAPDSGQTANPAPAPDTNTTTNPVRSPAP